MGGGDRGTVENGMFFPKFANLFVREDVTPLVESYQLDIHHVPGAVQLSHGARGGPTGARLAPSRPKRYLRARRHSGP